MNPPRIMAIDWSGRKHVPDQRRVIYLAETVDGEVVRVENGRTRDEIVELLIEEASRDANLIVGLDFAFSLPGWYLLERGLTAHSLWSALADEALTPAMRERRLAGWLDAPEPPFWALSKARALLAADQEFRRTEDDVRARGVQPKSVFKLVGAGQVGRGSLYGMQALHRLAAVGFQVWPFDAPALPLVVEIFPRLLTGPVTKNRQTERERYLERVALLSHLRRAAAASEDAFDAAVSAVVMARAIDELLALRGESGYELEGKIWQPHVPV